MCTGSRSVPRQGLPGDRQGPPWFLWSHSRTKYSSQGDKAPARGAGREGQPRHHKELAVTRHASRQGPVSGKLPDAARQRPRQGACRGKLPLCTRAPAHPPTCRSRTLPGVRGGRLCSQRCAVASGADKIAIVASDGVPDGRFCTIWATQTGIQCPCPLPSELGIEHYANTVPTTTTFTFLPSSVLPPVGDPFDL